MSLPLPLALFRFRSSRRCLRKVVVVVAMGKSDFLTPKAIANRIKSKGLQKLRWYCQMCQKQCRDEVSGRGVAPRAPPRLSGGTPLGMQAEVPDAAATAWVSRPQAWGLRWASPGLHSVGLYFPSTARPGGEAGFGHLLPPQCDHPQRNKE